MSKILCVIRVSTTHQETESQHNDMIGFLRSKGFEENSIIWLEVAGASARKANKEYLQMLETIKSTILNNNEITACAFWCLDRLGRIESYINLMKEWFTKNKIQVFVKQPSLTLLKEDGNVDAGANIAWSVFASMIAYNTEELMTKLNNGMRQKRAEGKFTGQKLPLGFKVDANKYVVVDNEKMNDVKMIFEEYASGKWSVNHLYKELHKRGYSYSEAHLNSILRREIYKPYVGDLWDKVQQNFKDHNIGIRTKESKYTHLALKVLKCPVCGHGFIGYADRNYRCFSQHNNYKNLKQIECTSPTISVLVMDTILYDIAMLAYKWQLEHIDTNNIEELKKRRFVIGQKIQQCNQELLKCSERKSRAIELYANGDIDKPKYQQLIGKSTSMYIQIQQEIENLNNEDDMIDEQIRLSQNPNIDAWVDLCVSSTEPLPVAEVKELIHKYIKVATVDKIEYQGNKATFILVIDSLGHEHKYIYNYRCGKAHIWTKKLMEVLQDGSIIPYLNDKKYNNRTEERRASYLETKQKQE